MNLPELIADLVTRVSRLLMVGTVAALDAPNREVILETDDEDGGVRLRMRWAETRAGEVADWSPPSVGEQFLVACPDGDPDRAVPVCALPSDANPGPAGTADEDRRAYSDGAVIGYDRANHILTATLPEGGEIRLTGKTKLTGDLEVTGNIKVSGTVDGVDISSHKHSYPDPETAPPANQALTGKPLP